MFYNHAKPKLLNIIHFAHPSLPSYNNTWLSTMSYVAGKWLLVAGERGKSTGYIRRGEVNPSQGRDRFTFVGERREQKREDEGDDDEATKNGARKCLDICYLPQPLEIINPVKSTKSYLSLTEALMPPEERSQSEWGRRRGYKEHRQRQRPAGRRRPWFRVVETLPPSGRERGDIYDSGKYFVQEWRFFGDTCNRNTRRVESFSTTGTMTKEALKCPLKFNVLILPSLGQIALLISHRLCLNLVII